MSVCRAPAFFHWSGPEFHKLARPNFCKPLRIVVVVEPITAVKYCSKTGPVF